jgi:hypothetical protein
MTAATSIAPTALTLSRCFGFNSDAPQLTHSLTVHSGNSNNKINATNSNSNTASSTTTSGRSGPVTLTACSHTLILTEHETNKQTLLQGHKWRISCLHVSHDKRWAVSGDQIVHDALLQQQQTNQYSTSNDDDDSNFKMAFDKASSECLLVVWDTWRCIPVKAIQLHQSHGLVALDMSYDHLLIYALHVPMKQQDSNSGYIQKVCVYEWTRTDQQLKSIH